MKITSEKPANTKNCYHCGNPFDGKIFHGSLGGEEKLFCCDGCKTVAELIYSSGNNFFYEIKGTTKTSPVEKDSRSETEDLDSDYIYEKFTTPISESIKKVYIKIVNIHCSACVWLNEKVLSAQKGIQKVEINFASGRASIEFDPSLVKISKIFELIRAIGYKPVLYSPSSLENKHTNNLKSLFTRLSVAGFCFGNIMLFSVALYSGYFSGIDKEFKDLLHIVSWVFATPAYLYSGFPFLRGAYSSIRSRTLTMDLLLFTGISIAYFYSALVTVTGKGEVYFDSVCMIYFFILVGKYFEERARVKASEEIENIICKLPEMVVQITESGEEKVISAELIQAKFHLKALPGNRIPVDGILLNESARLDESILTGESKPVWKKKGDTLLSGSIALESTIYYTAKTSYSDSSLSAMKHKLETALLEKPKIQLLTERMANLFIKIVFTLALLTFVFWWMKTGDIETSMVYTISVLIVACPCALGISVPTALVMNHILNSKGGIIIRNPNTIEPLAHLDVILFDKTGTLTEGKFQIMESDIQDPNIWNLIYLTEKESMHPIAISLVNYLKSQSLVDMQKIQNLQLLSFFSHSGNGVESEIQEGNRIWKIKLGKLDFIDANRNSKETPVQSETEIHLSIDGVYSGRILLGDNLKKESLSLVKNLQKDISDIRILSGDGEGPVKLVANKLEIKNYFFDLKPEDKMNITKELQNQKKTVALVGDGVNDALSLAMADVGISHSKAEDISIDKSDVVIVSGNMMSISQLIANAKLTRRVIKQNIVLSLMYNSIMLPLAMSGNMLPVICAVFMTLSSLTVLVNSISIQWRKEKIC